MPRVQLTERAELDLVDILTHLRRHAPRAADRLEATFEEKCRILSQYPQMGRARGELAPDLRSFSVERHLILYRPTADGIQVIRLVHGARDLPSLFGPDA